VTVAGRYVRGVPLSGKGTIKAKFAGAGYQQVRGGASVGRMSGLRRVSSSWCEPTHIYRSRPPPDNTHAPFSPHLPQVCGSAEVDGDFIVPTSAAHLDGAVNLEVEGAFHSPLGSKLAYFGPWYGDAAFLPAWADWVDGEWGALSSGEALSSLSSGSESEGEGGGSPRPAVVVVGGLPAAAAAQR
jgi:hypothetical protein